MVPTPGSKYEFEEIRTIVHKGSTLLIGEVSVKNERAKNDVTKKLVYSIYDESADTENNDTLFRDLEFPTMVRGNGLQLITLDDESVKDVNTKQPGNWVVISDDTYLYIFRAIPKINDTTGSTLLYANRYLLVPTPDEEEGGKTDNLLIPKTESRYQISRLKDTPANDLDKPSYKDLDGEFFQEPLMFFSEINPHNGWFTVILTPSDQGSTRRWLFFTANSDDQIQAYSFLRNNDGWPDLRTKDYALPLFSLREKVSPTDTKKVKLMGRQPASIYFRRQEESDDPSKPNITSPRVMLLTKAQVDEDDTERLVAIDFSLAENGLPIIPTVAENGELYLEIKAIKEANTALHFDGNSYVEIPFQETRNQEFTFECWVKNDGASGNIVSRAVGTADGEENKSGFNLSWNTDTNKLEATLSIIEPDDQENLNTTSQDKTYEFAIAAPSPSLHQWHHIAVRYFLVRYDNRKNEAIFDASFLINGIESGKKTQKEENSERSPVFNAKGTIYLGQKIGDPNNKWIGSLDEVRFWEKERTNDEIVENMYRELAAPESETGLIGYWKLDDAFEDRPSIALDSSTSEANGRVYGARWTTKTAPVDPPEGPDVIPQFKGLSTGMGLLDFTKGDTFTHPTLLSGADGLVHLYMGVTRGEQTLLGALQYDTTVSRAKYSLNWTAVNDEEITGTVQLFAHEAGPNLNQPSINPLDPKPVVSVTAVVGNKELVDVTFEAPAPLTDSESFTAVPRTLPTFAQVINGLASDDPLNPDVQRGNIPYYDYSGTRQAIEIPTSEGLPILLVVARDAEFPSALQLTKATVGEESQTLSVEMKPASSGDITRSFQPVLTIEQLNPNAPIFVRGLMGAGNANIDLTGANLAKLPTTTGQLYFIYAAETETFTGKVEFSPGDLKTCSVEISWNDTTSVWEEVPTTPAQFVNYLNTQAPTTGEDIRRHFVVVAANTGERIGQGELVEETPDLAPFFNIVGHSVAGNVMAGIYQTSPKQELTRHLSIDNNNSTASAFFQVMPYDPPEDGRPIHIMPMNGIQTQAGNFGGWVPTPPTTMGDFTKNQAIIPWGDTPNQEVLQIPGDFTYESWIRQTELSEKQRLLNVNAPATDTQYTVGFGVEEKALALSIPQNSPEASGKGELGAHDRVTLTCWWQPFPMGSQDRVKSSIVTLFNLRQRESSDTLSITLGFEIFAVDGENKFFWVIIQETTNGSSSVDRMEDVRLTPGWYFISLEIDLKNSNTLISKISWRHKDDPEFSSKSINIGRLMSNFTIIEQLTIGWIGEWIRFTNIKQSISNLALWSEFLTDDQLNSLYWSNPITATIPNAYLFGYWTPSNLTDTKLPNLAPNGKELTINLSSEITIEPWEKPWQPFFFCGAGSSFAKTDTTPDVLANMENNWTHVAAVCSNNQAVQFGDKKAAVVNDSEDFEFEQVLSIDGRFIADDIEGNAKYLVAKGDNDAQNYSYNLAIVNGKLTFAGWLIDNDGDKNGFGFSLQTQIEVGKPYYFGLSFQLISNNETGEVTFTQSNPNAPANKPNTATVESSSRTTTNKLLVHLALARLDRNVVGDIEIQQFNDNLPDNKTFKILPTTNPITIGSNAAEPSPQNPNAPLQYFVGKIADLRMWSRDISSDFVQPSQYTTPPAALQEGLEAHWRCNEGQGTTLKDSVGEHDATLDSVTMWTTSRLSTEFAIYLNGKEVATQPILANQVQNNNYGTRQFAIGFVGSYPEPDPAKSRPTEIFQGQMDELRLWNVPRSADEINDNMHLELSGNEDNLMGYWPISVGSGNIISDRSGYGNYATLINSNLTLFWWQPGEGEYSSPIGNEAPQIKNLLHGPTTRAQQGLATTSISASEYGALYVDADGITRGVLRRLYAYINSATKALSILPGFKVGDASLTFIGQAQSNPTLIGYIEGPPPVPGENLTRPYYKSIPRYQAYMGVASVTLTEDEDVTYSYSAQKDTGFDSSFGVNFGLESDVNIKALTAPLGLGVNTKIVGFKSKGPSVNTNFSYSLGFLESAQTDVGTKYSLTNYIEVGGNWEPKSEVESDAERHYLMDNLGYALVKSGVANVYALRLERTNTLIGIQMAPDPRIAEDFNIILFPINPLYTKQGTLDGMQGFKTDDDYPEANIQRGSYFKPYAAQDLEQQIEAHEASIEADYQAFDAGKKGRRQDTTHFTEGDPVDPESTIQSETDAEYDWENNRSKRNLVNTYVWTAGGGLFAEQEQTMVSRQESHSGSYSFQGMAGISASFSTTISSVGVYMETNALLGGHIQTNVTKQKAEGRDFGLAIKNDTEAFLAKWLPDKTEPENNGVAEPGKVDAYRFKSFYLAPDRDHFSEFFDTVIDPNWLLTSDSNDAFALRQARASGNNVWRVFHRVTYVSRVPPAFNQTPDDTAVQKKRSVIDAPQNALLIQLVNDVLTALEKTEPYSPEDIGNAVTEVLVGNYNYALVHHIPWWGDFLSNAAKDLNSIEAKDLARIKITVLSYMKAYFST
ncbi:LamG domain-containing protein [Okeania sp. SIO1F9]|uniref:LamG domain-containing protein n=1 Tax=Okeania sp. SIO1F9 TaxID=2607813 RepID=UPI00144F04F0|nr:LamG domain-containing protein [Okeania sp. SIO1F9]NET74541.1 LamG domain-containing protein [Okeania sp. SIO1F9]